MKYYLLLFALIFSPMGAIACSCINAGDFCTLLTGAIEEGKLVVRGHPLRTLGHGMEFEIEEVVAGAESKKRITVWGDPGYLCRVYVTGFEREDQLLMILDPITRERTESTTGQTERIGDYSLSVCGQYFIYLNGKFKEEVDCYRPEKKKPALISVFPNPTSRSFQLLNSEIEMADIIALNVYLPSGQLIFRKAQLGLLPKESGIEIATVTWPANLYFVEIRTAQDCWLTKVLVLR